MDHLWAPWRLAYVTAAKPPSHADKCFICQAQASEDDRANLLLLRGTHEVVILNRFPYNNGHLLVAPTRHKGRLDELDDAEALTVQLTIRRMVSLLDRALRPDGYNIGLNLGKAAGAGLPGHLHWHIVPRWNGDTNFMPVLGETQVLSQSLDTLYEQLERGLHEQSSGPLP
jgi:ATP adenylyltransferase